VIILILVMLIIIPFLQTDEPNLSLILATNFVQRLHFMNATNPALYQVRASIPSTSSSCPHDMHIVTSPSS
jgi:hypothetical protein